MTYMDLRQKYPKFVYDSYTYAIVDGKLLLAFNFSLPPTHSFTHKISIENFSPEINHPQLDTLIFQVGLSLMPSYWKAVCSPVIEIHAGNLTAKQLAWWHKLFIKGMSEYFYKNQIDFTPSEFLTINNAHAGVMRTGAQREARNDQTDEHLQSHIPNAPNQRVLIPIGGGKDSIVTLELLKKDFDIVPFVVNPVPIMYDVIKTSGVTNLPIIVHSQIDPKLLELNSQGYLNGHVPLSAMYAFLSLLSAHLSQTQYIAFSNERSSNEGNTTYLDHEINHQYSKSLEFETDFNNYLKSINYQLPATSYFSLLRPLYELQITGLFSKMDKYFPVFSSCNRNFTIDPKHHPKSLWCTHCPKCVSTGLMLAAFIGKEKVTEIMGAYPPDLPENQQILNELLGKIAIKPFECILTREEAQAALEKVQTGKSAKFDQLMSSWLDNPNLPLIFVNILKSAYVPT